MQELAFPVVEWLDCIRDEHRASVGGKAANLAKLIQAGFNCPRGFCVTTEAFSFALQRTGLYQWVKDTLQDSARSAEECASMIRSLLSRMEIPPEIAVATIQAHRQMVRRFGCDLVVAVRSSALSEDSEGSSFAGQFDSFLGVADEQDLLRKIVCCWMSLFNARSIAYVRRKAVGALPLAMGTVVQKLVRATKAGVMLTAHPVTSDADQIVVEATFGFGERLVSGRTTPDTYVLSKRDLVVVQAHIAEKQIATVFDYQKHQLVEAQIPPDSRDGPVLGSDELGELARVGRQIEAHFGTPQDIEWAMEGETVYIVQARPMTALRR